MSWWGWLIVVIVLSIVQAVVLWAVLLPLVARVLRLDADDPPRKRRKRVPTPNTVERTG